MKVLANAFLISLLSLQLVGARFYRADPRSLVDPNNYVQVKPFGNEQLVSPLGNNNLSQEEVDLIKQRILDGLGMKAIPTYNLTDFTKAEIDEAYRDYAKAVEEEERRYQSLELEEVEDDEEEVNPTSKSYEFSSVKVTKPATGRDRRDANNGDQIIHFYVALPATVDLNTTSVAEANARFWKRGALIPLENETFSEPSTVEVAVYRLDNVPRGKISTPNLKPVYIRSYNVSRYGNEWLQIDMTEAVRTWVRNPYIDNGVLLHCPKCEAAGVRFLTGSRKKTLTAGSKVPRLNVKTEIIGSRRIKRSHKMRKRNKLADCYDATHPRGRKSKRCCRRSMQVRFVDLPRFDFILSPKEFDAFYCSGRCPPRYNPATQHALFQSLVNLRGENNVPKPCCAPTKLKGLNILHIGDDGRMKTSFWSDVIVTECGCA